MKKLEKSIRHELESFGPSLRNGHVWVTGHSTGIIGSNDYFMDGAYADLDVADGIVTAIRIYAVGEGKLSRDLNEGTLNITEYVEEYILNHDEYFDWDDLICSIEEAAEEMIRNAEKKLNITDLEILMMDGCTKHEAERYLKDGTSVFEDFEEFFDSYMQEWGIEDEDVVVYKRMITQKIPAPDWGIVEAEGKTYYIEYVL